MLARQLFNLAQAGQRSSAAAVRTTCFTHRLGGAVRCIGVRPPQRKQGAPPIPRTTTHPKHIKLKKPTKYAAALMTELDLERRLEVDRSKDDNFEVGDAVMVKAYDYASQPKPAVYKGVVIAIKNKGLGTTFRILNTFDGEKFEMTFPLYSPLLGPVKVVKKNRIKKKGKKVRRAKLYYLRDLQDDKFFVP